jgi:hypothetical protein
MKPRQPDGRPAPARLAEDVALNWLYQDQHLGWLALVFASDRPEQVDRQITHWLQALQQTTPEQQQHYYQLSRRRFQALSPSISCASGHSALPPGAARRVRRFLRRPAGRPHGQPGLPDAAPGATVATQGFSLPLSRWSPRPVSDPALAFAFYPQAAGELVAESPEEAAPLLPPVTGRAAEAPAATALLLLARSGRRAGARGTAAPIACRPAPCRGHGEWHLFDGSWQLILQLPASGQRPEAILQAIVRQLALPVAPLPPPPESIAIRHLMAQLPERLGTSAHQEGWLAALTGGSAEDAQWVARQLSLLTVPVNPPMPAPAPAAAASNGWLIPGAIRRCWSLFRCRKAPRWRPCGCWRSSVSRRFSSACGWSSR